MNATPLRVPLRPLGEGRGELPAAAARYVALVHRAAPGDPLLLVDYASAREADAEIVELTPGRVVVVVGPARAATSVPPRHVTLLQALAKGDKPDAVVRDATELGASRVWMVRSERSVLRPDEARLRARVERWRRVAVEAARQCGRGDVPQIDPPADLADAWGAVEGRRLVLVPGAEASVGGRLAGLGEGEPVAFAVGPEGGFSPAEIESARSAGWLAASLGPFVVRTETAAAASLGALWALT